MSNSHNVIVILEAKVGKEAELETSLLSVAENSRAETANIEYRLHKSIDNPQQFILYEIWESQEQHQQQFEKPYIQEFGAKLDSLLAKPYEAYFSKEI